jgi:hypothetical protein
MLLAIYVCFFVFFFNKLKEIFAHAQSYPFFPFAKEKKEKKYS